MQDDAIQEDLGSGRSVIERLQECSALLDARLIDLRVRDLGGAVEASLRFEPRKGSLAGILDLTIVGLTKFDFYYDCDSAYYYIERYKLLEGEHGGVILSLDPYDESCVLTEDDRGVFIGKELHGRVLA